jgi:hypothetical protein
MFEQWPVTGPAGPDVRQDGPFVDSWCGQLAIPTAFLGPVLSEARLKPARLCDSNEECGDLAGHGSR